MMNVQPKQKLARGRMSEEQPSQYQLNEVVFLRNRKGDDNVCIICSEPTKEKPFYQLISLSDCYQHEVINGRFWLKHAKRKQPNQTILPFCKEWIKKTYNSPGTMLSIASACVLKYDFGGNKEEFLKTVLESNSSNDTVKKPDVYQICKICLEDSLTHSNTPELLNPLGKLRRLNLNIALEAMKKKEAEVDSDFDTDVDSQVGNSQVIASPRNQQAQPQPSKAVSVHLPSLTAAKKSIKRKDLLETSFEVQPKKRRPELATNTISYGRREKRERSSSEGGTTLSEAPYSRGNETATAEYYASKQIQEAEEVLQLQKDEAENQAIAALEELSSTSEKETVEPPTELMQYAQNIEKFVKEETIFRKWFVINEHLNALDSRLDSIKTKGRPRINKEDMAKIHTALSSLSKEIKKTCFGGLTEGEADCWFHFGQETVWLDSLAAHYAQ